MYILLWDRSDPYDAGQQDGVARPVKSEGVFFEIAKSRPNCHFATEANPCIYSASQPMK
jgi:hypothetical protein